MGQRQWSWVAAVVGEPLAATAWCHRAASANALPALRGDGDRTRFAPRASFRISLLGSGRCGHTAAVFSSCLRRQAAACSAEQDRVHVCACGVAGDPLSVPCCLGVGTWITGALLSLISQTGTFISGTVAVSLKAVRLARVQGSALLLPRSRIDGWHVPVRYWPPDRSSHLFVCVQQLSAEKCVCWEWVQHPPRQREEGRWLMGCVGLLWAGPWPPRDPFISCSSEKHCGLIGTLRGNEGILK